MDGKLAFIVTLRESNRIAKVFRSDINTNSLRHAVPFQGLCEKYHCKNVYELEQKLVNDANFRKKPLCNAPIIKISITAPNSSLKHLASAVTANTSSSSKMQKKIKKKDDVEINKKTQKQSVYNLRSTKKRKFGQLNDEDNKSNTPCVITPSSARPTTPNKVGEDKGGKHRMSAPNTPILNGRNIINLVNSPSSSKFPSNCSLNGLNGINGLNAQSLQQLQQLIMLQKQMSNQTNIPINNGTITKITNLSPYIPTLPRLESDENTTDNSVINEDEPPRKKQKISHRQIPTLGANREPFWSERLLSIHHTVFNKNDLTSCTHGKSFFLSHCLL